MKIAQFTPYPLSLPGGVNQHVLALTDGLERLGHDVSIIAPEEVSIRKGYYFSRLVKQRERNIYTVGGALTLPVFSTSIPISTGLPYANDIDKFLKRMDFDLIHFHNPTTPLLSWQFLMQSNTVNIVTFHAYVGDDSARSFSKGLVPVGTPFLKRLFKRFDGAIAVSKMAKKTARGYYLKPITIIPNGVALDRFHPNVKPLEKFADDFEKTILFVGRIEARKGLTYLLDAVKILQQKGQKVRLVVVGDGHDREETEKYVKKHRIKQIVFEGFVPDEILPRYYASCDVFCSPATHNESFGIVLLEALATKKPVVAFDNAGYRDLLIPLVGKEVLAPNRNTQALSQKLETILTDKSFAKAIASKGYDAVQPFEWGHTILRILDFYQQFIH